VKVKVKVSQVNTVMHTACNYIFLEMVVCHGRILRLTTKPMFATPYCVAKGIQLHTFLTVDAVDIQRFTLPVSTRADQATRDGLLWF
jgi:hypothetical protein